uniref:Mab-21 domain-containing protein n=1 Tax=Heterorhabditis bacteriophora TaxID=37862 RepID=A0A1I7WK61_HETBA
MFSIFETVNANPCSGISNTLNSFLLDDSNPTVFNLNPDGIYMSIRRKKAADTNEALQDSTVAKVFLHHSLISPRSLFRVTHKEIEDDARHLLECIVQFVGFAVANKGYGNSKWYLTSLNKQIQKINEQFKLFISQQTMDCRLEDIYGFNEITQFDPSHKPKLNLMEKDLNCILTYLKENVTVLAPDSSDCVHMLVSSSCLPMEMEADKTIILHLHPMIEMTGAGDGQELFVRTKKYVVDLLMSGCRGSNIVELISLKAENNEEELHRRRYNPENMYDTQIFFCKKFLFFVLQLF